MHASGQQSPNVKHWASHPQKSGATEPHAPADAQPQSAAQVAASSLASQIPLPQAVPADPQKAQASAQQLPVAAQVVLHEQPPGATPLSHGAGTAPAAQPQSIEQLTSFSPPA